MKLKDVAYLASSRPFLTLHSSEFAGFDPHEVYKKAAVIIRRVVRTKDHTHALSLYHSKGWIYKYKGYMYRRKMAALDAYESSYVSKEEWMQQQGYR